MIFINTVTPFLQIFIPPTGEFARFQGGKLEIDKDHPHFPFVMAEAQRNPAISIMANETTCPQCGETFEGRTAKMKLGAHRKEVHFDEWLADKEAADVAETQREIKSRAGYACDVCAPIQTFGDPDALARHVVEVHTIPPAMDEQGNELGGGAAAEVDTAIPAATGKQADG